MSDPDEGSQLAKRRRVARACDQCRHGKLRCDGRSPRCSKCLETRKPCSYGAAAKRRGLKTGYVRALECLWGLVLQKIDGSEAAVESLLGRASVLDFRGRDQNAGSTGDVENLLASWKRSKIPEKINQLLASTDDSDDEATGNPLETVQGFEQHHPLISWRAYAQQPGEDAQIPQITLNTAEKDLVGSLESSLGEDEIRTTTGCDNANVFLYQPTIPHLLKLPSTSSRLIDWYFTYTHCWLPIVERHVVFRTLFSYPAEGFLVTRKSLGSGDHAVLWAILACASLEEAQTEVTPTSFAESIETSELFYAHARNLIPWENEHEYCLEHVQALTILAICRWIARDYKAASSIITYAISIAFSIDLDQINTAWQHQKCHADRVWLGCFVVESLLAMRLKRVPYLKPQAIEPCLPIDDSGMEEWEPWRPLRSHSDAEPSLPIRTSSTFSQLVRLVCIANNLLHLDPGDASLQAITSLIDWTAQLPRHCKQAGCQRGRGMPDRVPPPNIVNLGFVYLCLVIQLHINPSDHQIEKLARKDTEVIIQFCGSGASERLPPSWEILADAASAAQSLPIQSREAVLKQLKQDLARLGFGDSGLRTNTLTRNAYVLHLYDEPQHPSVMDSTADTSCVSRTNPLTERGNFCRMPETSGHGTTAFAQTVRAKLSRFPTTQQQEDIMTSSHGNYRFPRPGTLPLDVSQRCRVGTVQQRLAHEMLPAEDGNPRVTSDSAAAQTTDFSNTETLPAMTEEDPFLDYLELFDNAEMFVAHLKHDYCTGANSRCRQDQDHFMKALGYNV
ncbi:hypothetical protein LTR84_006133 [Exophiala bonariae]|uniref:Zn(2)-C6 fungal-type domain-containing protein n=1 Tax=Exophiala bonariae TaxID=1690606 RepID=A0AAV9N1X8_9EURO|nr:hypothetical protein LTR84_006133 [Exophiala bonariae]